MRKSINYHAALCAYRDTPVTGGYSPAELLFGRSLNSMGIHRDKRVDVKRLKLAEENSRQYQAQYYDSKHRVQNRQPLVVNQQVTVNDPGKRPQTAQVVATSGREAVVISEKQQLLRRNRSLLSNKPSTSDDSISGSVGGSTATEARGVTPSKVQGLGATHHSPMSDREPTQVRTSSGRVIKKPNRLDL